MMKKILLSALLAVVAMCASAIEKTDVIPGQLLLTASYEQQALMGPSGATWLVTLKDDGNGPQCKAGNSGIVVNKSVGLVKSVTVQWASKSNENLNVYGSHTPFSASNDEITGELIGTLQFSANAKSTLTIDADWEYIGIAATSVRGKACQFKNITVVWDAIDTNVSDAQDGIVINEVCGNDDTAEDGSEDWIELANATDHAISLAGLQLVKVDDYAGEEILYTYSEGDELEAGGFLLCKRKVHFESGIPHSRNMVVKLVSSNGKTLDIFDKRAELTDNGHHNKGGSYSRFPDMTGGWMAAENATPGEANDGTPIAQKMRTYQRVSSDVELADGMKVILVNEAHGFAMSSSWATTKDGAVYQLAEECLVVDGMAEVDVNRVAVCTLTAVGDGTWAFYFGETNNYMNEERFLACEVFKSLDFKTAVTKKNVAAIITFNVGGDAEISYGATAGSIKFNYKGDGTDRFLNYDPTDKPENHLAVHIYKLSNKPLPTGIEGNVEPEKREVYNVSGQKVAHPTNGLYIINGKVSVNK